MSRIELEGELLVVVEENNSETNIVAEICGFDIWKWLENNDGNKIKITLEKED